MITVTLPFDTPVNTASRIGAYLQTEVDDWEIVPGNHLSVSNANEPQARAVLARVVEMLKNR